jgi:FMN phosphatase YigB (HAD superfamily)
VRISGIAATLCPESSSRRSTRPSSELPGGERLRAETHEVPHRRLELFYGRVGADPDRVPPELTERLLATHMSCLVSAAEAMPGQADLLDWLSPRYRLGVVSNFDYTPTVRRILTDGGILGRFETVVVSDTRWRKRIP